MMNVLRQKSKLVTEDDLRLLKGCQVCQHSKVAHFCLAFVLTRHPDFVCGCCEESKFMAKTKYIDEFGDLKDLKELRAL